MTTKTDKIRLKKGKVELIDHLYNPQTSQLLRFIFELDQVMLEDTKLKTTRIHHYSIDSQSLYTLDHFFTSQETNDLVLYSKQASFSKSSYGSLEAISRGEQPAKTMNSQERWALMSKPPSAIQSVFELLGLIASKLDIEISTLPWELCDFQQTGSPGVICNYVEKVTKESMDLGIHQDSSPSKHLSFAIPCLYSKEAKNFHSQFKNGATGQPYIVSLMVYATDLFFDPTFQMGTAFFNHLKEYQFSVNCDQMRMVLFESDLWHTLEASCIPQEVKTWRVSYVFKLIMNPKKQDQSIPQLLSTFFATHSDFSFKNFERFSRV